MIISGGRQSTTFGVDLLTGEKKYECGFSGCFQQPLDTDIGNESRHGSHLLMIERHSQVVRAHSPRSGQESWNFDVGEYNIFLLNENSNCRMSSERDDTTQAKDDFKFKIVVPDGHVSLIDGPEKSVPWSQKFEAPIVAVWQLNDKRLQQIDLFSSNRKDRYVWYQMTD